MKIAFNPSTVAALTSPPNNKDITFDLRGRSIFARGVKFLGTDTWRLIKVNNVSIGTDTLDLCNGTNVTLVNKNGIVTLSSTWRPVVNGLTSTATDQSLSANMGSYLKSLIDGKADSTHNHDDLYLKLSGGTMANKAIISFADSKSWEKGTGALGDLGGIHWTGQSDGVKLYASETDRDNLNLRIKFTDDNSNCLQILNASNTVVSEITAAGEFRNSYIRTYSDTVTHNTSYKSDRRALIIAGNTYGNDKNYIDTSGKLSWNDGGPQIIFSTSRDNFNGVLSAALIYTDHDTIGAGVSLSLVSNLSDAYFIAPHIKALSNFVGNLDWDFITNKPSFYTETEIDDFLDAKLDRVNLTTSTWNPRGYNLAADYHYEGGDVSFAESGGLMHVSIDGKFWLNEGLYRVLDTSDVNDLKSNLTINQYISSTDTTWYPLIWGGDSHNNTTNSTGLLYKSHDVLSWLTSSQTLYTTKLQTTDITFPNSGTSLRGIQGTVGDNDYWRIKGGATASNSGFLEIATADDGTEPIYVRQYTGVFGTVKRTLTLLDGNGFSYFPSYINIGGNENNNSSPDRVWGSNGSDSFLRSYRTSALNVNNADTVDNYHISNETRQVYLSNYPVDNPSGSWVLIKFPAWDSVHEIVSISGSGDNRRAHCVVHCGSRDQGIWGYQSDYNGPVVDKIRWKEADGGKFALVVLISTGITSLNIKATCSLEISKTTEDTEAFAIYSNFFSSSGVFHGAVDWNKIEGKPGSFNPSSHEHTYILDIDNKKQTTFAYSRDELSINSITWLAVWNGYLLRAMNKNQVALSGHNHDGRYLCLTGGTMTGALNFANNTWNLVGDDAYIGDHNLGGRFCIKSANSDSVSGIAIYNRAESAVANLWFDNTNINIDKQFVVQNHRIWVQGVGTAGGNNNRLNLVSGMPSGLAYNTSCRGTILYSNGIAFADPYNGNSNNDSGWIRHLETSANAGTLEIAVGDDNSNEEIHFRWYNTNSSAETIGNDITVPRATGTLALTSQIPTSLPANGGNADTVDWYHANLLAKAWSASNSTMNLVALYHGNYFGMITGTGVDGFPNNDGSWTHVFQASYNNNSGGDGNTSNFWITLIANRAGTTSPWIRSRSGGNNISTGWTSWVRIMTADDVDKYYWANVKISTSSNTQTQPSVNTIYANNWFRSQGATGWYSESYGGGIFMLDSTWIRTYGGKPFYCDKLIYSSDSIRMGSLYLLYNNEFNCANNDHIYINYRGNGNVRICDGGGKVGIGIDPLYKLDVKGAIRGSYYGHSSAPTIIATMRIHRNSLSSTALYGDIYSVDSKIKITYISIENGWLKISLGGSGFLVFTAHADVERVFTGEYTYLDSDYNGRSRGAYWLNTWMHDNNQVWIRAFRLGNSDNDSWASNGDCFARTNDWPIMAINVTLIGYLT